MIYKYKLVFLAGCLGQGGSEKQLYYLIKGLRNAGHSVILLSLTSGEFWEDEIKKLGIEVINITSKSRIARLFQISRLLRHIRPDLIFSMHFFANIYAAIPGRLFGIKCAGSIRSNGLLEIKSLGFLMAGISYYLPDMIVANSYHGLDNIKEKYPGKRNISFLSNVIDTDTYTSVYFSSVPIPPVFTIIARLKSYKRIELFIDLIYGLKNSGITAQGVIVGYGEEENALKSHAEFREVSDRIVFTGKQDDVRTWLNNSYCLISVSELEGTSNSVLEAMASSVPVLCMQYDGVEDLIINNENGLIFRELDEMVNGAIRLIGSVELRNALGENARLFIKRKYDLSYVEHNFFQSVKI